MLLHTKQELYQQNLQKTQYWRTAAEHGFLMQSTGGINGVFKTDQGNHKKRQDTKPRNKTKTRNRMSVKIQRKRQLSWWGQVQRIQNSRKVKQVWQARRDIKRRREDHYRPGIALL